MINLVLVSNLLVMDKRDSWKYSCEAKQHVSQQNPKVQDCQHHIYSSAEKHEP